MPAHLSRAELAEAFAVLDRVEVDPAPREVAALAMRLDSWVEPSARVSLPDGTTYPEPGVALGAGEGCTYWLLRHGRLLTVSASEAVEQRSEAVEPRLDLLVDVDLVETRLADRLRHALLRDYLGSVDLVDTPGPLVPRVVADLLLLERALNPAGRELVLGTLAQAMRPGEGWDQSAARLRTGFEGALGDRSRSVSDIAVRALVAMAAGLGPRVPSGDPSRDLRLLLGAPRPEVRETAMNALLLLPADRLEALRQAVEPLLPAALADESLEVRRLAGELQRRLHPGDEADDLAGQLVAPDRLERLAGLRRWSQSPPATASQVIPLVVGATRDDDPAVSEAAVEALLVMLPRLPADDGRIVVHGLITDQDERAVIAGIRLIRAQPDLVTEHEANALRDALDRELADRGAVAEALADTCAGMHVDKAVPCYESMLWHKDPAVRAVGLRRLVADGASRVHVREPLVPVLVELLSDTDPAVRSLAASAVVGMRLPNAASIISGLAFDPDAAVRSATLALLGEAGAGPLRIEAERNVELVDAVFHLASSGDPDERVRWTGALERLAAIESPRVTPLLVELLRSIDATAGDPFAAFAADEVLSRIVARVGCGPELAGACRHLLAPPRPRPDAAAKLAAVCADEDPLALDFLWTLATVATGEPAAAAREALRSIAGNTKSAEVERALDEMIATAASPAERSLLRLVRRG